MSVQVAFDVSVSLVVVQVDLSEIAESKTEQFFPWGRKPTCQVQTNQ